jgi:hypothetical protein
MTFARRSLAASPEKQAPGNHAWRLAETEQHSFHPLTPLAFEDEFVPWKR